MTQRQQTAIFIAIGGITTVVAGVAIGILVQPMIGVIIAATSVVEFGFAAWYWRRPV